MSMNDVLHNRKKRKKRKTTHRNIFGVLNREIPLRAKHDFLSRFDIPRRKDPDNGGGHGCLGLDDSSDMIAASVVERSC